MVSIDRSSYRVAVCYCISDGSVTEDIKKLRERAKAAGWTYLGLATTIGMSPRMWRPPDGGMCVSETHLAERLDHIQEPGE